MIHNAYESIFQYCNRQLQLTVTECKRVIITEIRSLLFTRHLPTQLDHSYVQFYGYPEQIIMQTHPEQSHSYCGTVVQE